MALLPSLSISEPSASSATFGLLAHWVSPQRALKLIDALAIMATMSIENHSNNQRFCELVQQTGLSHAVAMTLLNRGRAHPITESCFKAWLASPQSKLWCEMSNEDLELARAALNKHAPALTRGPLTLMTRKQGTV